MDQLCFKAHARDEIHSDGRIAVLLSDAMKALHV
eukprot:CAMPEP_0119305602 /NCGR_PEP_ID=MMETSP1333-20130426/6565_1 /TAXON_ID=418940 /ORGANISM="Scyphosphaera apsteinii, Strain RCC1455" /LENGTH=33 /DNA_ID= /DNA_START= /DNA_END= /DNA_ORIENTATION=